MRLSRVAIVRLVLTGLVVVALVFVFVYPTRAYLAKRAERDRAAAELALIERENARLAADTERLQSDAEIERLARERYNLVMPGEDAFAIVPAETTTTTPTTTPTTTATATP